MDHMEKTMDQSEGGHRLAAQQPRRLHIGASQLEYIAISPSAVTIDPSWVHLGDSPNFEPYYEKGTVVSRLKILARKGLRKFVPEIGHRPDLYQRTNFKAWIFRDGDRLDFADDQFSFAYSEHFFEHLRFDIVVQLFREMHRVLMTGGVIRIVVPDADYRTYEAPEPAGFPGAKLGLSHPNKHKIRWNVYMLTSVFESVGFKAIPLVYCDENGKFINRPPAEVYSQISPVADQEFVTTLNYVKRSRSLIVDGIKL